MTRFVSKIKRPSKTDTRIKKRLKNNEQIIDANVAVIQTALRRFTRSKNKEDFDVALSAFLEATTAFQCLDLLRDLSNE